MSNKSHYQPPDWIHKPLHALTNQQWEQLCDGCGKCCLHKYYADDEDIADRMANEDFPQEQVNHPYLYSQMTCELYDVEAGQCSRYHTRHRYVPDCVQLTIDMIPKLDWLPSTCAYLLRYHDQPLPSWHPLISGTSESVHEAGASIRAWAVEFNYQDDPLDYPLDFIP